MVLLALLSTSIAVRSSTTRPNTKSDCRILSTTENDGENSMNETFCSYTKEYALTEVYKVTVCLFNRKITVGIRAFSSGKPTKGGVFMNKRDWDYLQHLIPFVNSAVKRAEISKRHDKNQ